MKHAKRNIAALSVFILGSLAASYAATVNVPFAFEAKGISFPAGRYSVSESSNHGFVTLQSKDNPAKQFTWVAHPDNSDGDDRVVLSFDRGDSGTVLTRIRLAQLRTSRLSNAQKTISAEKQHDAEGN